MLPQLMSLLSSAAETCVYLAFVQHVKALFINEELLAELDEILAETEKVSPQVDAYLADNGATHSKGHKKQTRQTDDIEAQ